MVQARETRGLLLGVRSHPEPAGAEVEVAALVGDTLPLHGGDDLAGSHVDHARGQVDLGLALAPPDPDALDPHAPTALLGGEAGDGAGDDVLHALDLADLGQGGRVRFRPVAVGEVLLREHGVELLALDHAEASVVHEGVHDLVGHPLADVVLPPPVVDSPVLEIHHRDLGSRRLGRLRGRSTCEAENGDGGQARGQLTSHPFPSSSPRTDQFRRALAGTSTNAQARVTAVTGGCTILI
jgi:hypothetical protein